MSAAAEELVRMGAESRLHGAGVAKERVRWAQIPVRERVAVLRRARHRMAERAEDLAAAISPRLVRTRADTMVAEVLPLLDACRFLEHEAESLLAPRRLGRRRRPLWLTGVVVEIHREPLGHVLVIGPSNFPLFLPGVQVLQALEAGNTATWKPGAGGAAVAQMVAKALLESGLPEGVLTVTDESVEAAETAIAAGPDKVVFTGSVENGRSVLERLAVTATPAVVEMSGADAVIVRRGADLTQVVKAVAFGLRLNGGAVCMSPRRLFAEPEQMRALRPLLLKELGEIGPARLDSRTAKRLEQMVDAAVCAGAEIHGEVRPEEQRALVVDGASEAMEITCSDVFAPVISLIEVRSMEEVAGRYARCGYGLTVAIFCGKRDEMHARSLARELKAGTVLINDLIAPTADPRVPFGGRGMSGYGVTRGAEGLLEMTAVKSLIVRRGGSMRHMDRTKEEDVAMFAGLIGAMHGEGIGIRWAALRRAMRSVRR